MQTSPEPQLDPSATGLCMQPAVASHQSLVQALPSSQEEGSATQPAGGTQQPQSAVHVRWGTSWYGGTTGKSVQPQS